MRVRGHDLQTTLELKQFLMAWTAAANQEMKISLANTTLLAEAEEFSFRGEFFFPSILRQFCTAALTGYSEVLKFRSRTLWRYPVFRIRAHGFGPPLIPKPTSYPFHMVESTGAKSVLLICIGCLLDFSTWRKITGTRKLLPHLFLLFQSWHSQRKYSASFLSGERAYFCFSLPLQWHASNTVYLTY